MKRKTPKRKVFNSKNYFRRKVRYLSELEHLNVRSVNLSTVSVDVVFTPIRHEVEKAISEFWERRSN